MKNYKTILSVLLLFTFFTSACFSQDLGIKPNFSSQRMSPEMLRSEINKLELENFGSGIMTLAGVATIGFSVVAVSFGYHIITSEPSGTLPVDLIGAFVGISLMVYGITLLPAGILTSAVFIDNMAINNKIIGELEIELKHYRQTSFNDKPGTGIGISIPLNFH